MKPRRSKNHSAQPSYVSGDLLARGELASSPALQNSLRPAGLLVSQRIGQPRGARGDLGMLTAEDLPGRLIERPAQAFIALVKNSFPSALFHPRLDCHKINLH